MKTNAKLMALLAIFAPAVVTAEEESEDRRIETIDVFGTRIEDASSLLRNGLEVQEISRSVQIIDNETISEIKPQGLQDILMFTSNAAFLGSNDGRETSFTLRGFPSPPILVDGFRLSQWGSVSDPEIYGIEQVEILKGPDSILYGEANPGGIINMRAKRPTQSAGSEVMVDAGDDGYFSPRFDINSGFSDSLLFRVIGLYEQDDTYRDYNTTNKRTFFAPSARLAFGSNTSLTLFVELTDDDNAADFGNVSLNGELLGPISQINNGPDDTMERHMHNVGVDFTQMLSYNWQLDARVRSVDSGYEYSVLWLPAVYDEINNQVIRAAANQTNQTDEIASQLSVSGDFHILGLRNRLVTGIDYRTTEQVGGGGYDPQVRDIIDWSNPDYSNPTPPLETLGVYSFTEEGERSALFAQNHLSITDDLLLSLGARYDEVDRVIGEDENQDEQKLDNVSSSIGLSYNINGKLTVYGSYSEAFAPNTNTDKFNEYLDPELSEGFEIGLKGELTNNLAFTLAWFDITKQNVAVDDPSALTDPESLNPFGMMAVGEQTAQGAELDVSWTPTENFYLMVNYGFANNGVLDRDENGELGDAGNIQGAPEDNGSIWTSYVLPVGNVDLTFGGGVQYIGERYITEGFTLEPYTLANVYVRANLGNWQAQVNVQNATDERYISETWAATAARGVHAGEPRAIIASVSYRF